MTTAEDTAPAAGVPMFYSRPVPLQADAHADLRVLPGRLGFAAGANALPVLVSEFSAALHHLPILFAGENAVPMAAMGFGQHNLFIKDGFWEEGAYVPAYIRRHPFILIDTDGGQNFLLGIEEDSERLVRGGDEGQPLFVDGKPTDMVQQALDFCGQYTRDHEHTRAFSQALLEQDLLVTRSATMRAPDGREQSLQGFRVVDVDKYTALSDEVVLDWHRKGWLALVHQHLMSLGRFGDLSRREALRG